MPDVHIGQLQTEELADPLDRSEGEEDDLSLLDEIAHGGGAEEAYEEELGVNAGGAGGPGVGELYAKGNGWAIPAGQGAEYGAGMGASLPITLGGPPQPGSVVAQSSL
eukprot:gene30252-37788_t